jgi:hypothetical protein
VCPEVVDVVAVLLQHTDEVLLQGVAGVIAADGNAHPASVPTGPEPFREGKPGPASLSHRAASVGAVDRDELPHISPRHLRTADEMCRRRLAREIHSGKRNANKTADMRFAVSNRIEADARLAQAECGPPRPEAFVDPRELEPEQRSLYRAAAQGYLDEFGARDALVVDLGFRTELPALGVELSANLGIAAEGAGGRRELRKVVVGARRDAPLLDTADVQVALVRTEEWAPVQLEIVAVDVIEQRRVAHAPDLDADRAEAHAWVASRVERILELASDGRARAGRDCQGCAFIAGCAEHPG